MAKTTLPTNYVDDVLNGAMDGKRRYREIPNADGTISLEDATTYDQVGSNFGASQLNLMSDNINQSFDANKMLKTMDEVNAVTQEGYGADALVVKQLSESLGDISKVGNSVYNSIEKLLRYYIDNGYLPDINNTALIPKMTSNTTPSGECYSTLTSSGFEPYRMFDGNNETSWEGSINGVKCCYRFSKPVILRKAYVYSHDNYSNYSGCGVTKFTLYASNDGTDWTTLGAYDITSGGEKYVDINDNNSYLYVAISADAGGKSGIIGPQIGTLQFYGSYA